MWCQNRTLGFGLDAIFELENLTTAPGMAQSLCEVASTKKIKNAALLKWSRFMKILK